eukprot:GHVU01158861.1.p1 GENE.GHVU01158861.1~~GHVU01158861.1.p1  ORF type:complete len:134 (+),score=24.95 GHVU01158861.1:202-603(+)
MLYQQQTAATSCCHICSAAAAAAADAKKQKQHNMAMVDVSVSAHVPVMPPQPVPAQSPYRYRPPPPTTTTHPLNEGAEVVELRGAPGDVEEVDCVGAALERPQQLPELRVLIRRLRCRHSVLRYHGADVSVDE